MLLKCVLAIQKYHHHSSSSSSSSQKLITTIDAAKANSSSNNNNNNNNNNNKSSSSSVHEEQGNYLLAGVGIQKELFLTALYFALGFLFTNYGFQSGTTVFVETIKAGEPITSSTIAVLYGIETLNHMEVVSLLGIVSGVILSTMGSSSSSISSSISISSSSSSTLIVTCLTVMASNVCFSFRGLYQKLFRLTPYGNTSQIDDITLQYKMQLIGATLLVLPATWILYFGGGNSNSSTGSNSGIDDDIEIYNHHHHHHHQNHHSLPVHRHLHDHHPSLMSTAAAATTTTFYSMEYALLSLANGIAFASYNLASTYILSRISVIHHAVLNCIRRVFAIVVTSIIFGLVITSLQVYGILIAMTGFVSYVHYKSQKEGRDGRRRALRAKYSNVILTHGGSSSRSSRYGSSQKRNNGYSRRSSHSSSLTASYLPTINPLTNK
jgi:drug/metabolite transporter (DMT)-like permease